MHHLRELKSIRTSAFSWLIVLALCAAPLRSAQCQQHHPGISLDALLRHDPLAGDARAVTDALYATDALVVDAVYARSGIAGVRDLAKLGRDTRTIVAALPARLGLDPSNPAALDDWWRREASLRVQRAIRSH